MEDNKKHSPQQVPDIDSDGYHILEKDYLDGDITFDKRFKRVFSNYRILAAVIKNTVDLYGHLSIDEIVKLIKKPDPERNVSPGLTNLVTPESSEPGGESTVHFDVYTEISLPESREQEDLEKLKKIRFCVYYDLEMQRRNNPGYRLPKRGVFYASRMVSSQIPAVKRKTDYDAVQPVYSVWIVLEDSSFPLVNRAVRFGLSAVNLDELGYARDAAVQGQVDALNSEIGLVSVIFVYIDRNIIETGEVPDGASGIAEFISRMIVNDLTSEEMKKFINIQGNDEIVKEVTGMTALMRELKEEWAAGEAAGRAAGEVKGIIRAGRSFGRSDNEILEIITEAVKCTAEDARRYLLKYDSEQNEEFVREA